MLNTISSVYFVRVFSNMFYESKIQNRFISVDQLEQESAERVEQEEQTPTTGIHLTDVSQK